MKMNYPKFSDSCRSNLLYPASIAYSTVKVEGVILVHWAGFLSPGVI